MEEGKSCVLLDTVGSFNKNNFFKTVQHKLKLGVARNTGCTVGKGNHMPERAYNNVRVYLGINEDLLLSKSPYHGSVRQIRLIVWYMHIRIK